MKRRLLDTIAVYSVEYRVDYNGTGVVQCPAPDCDAGPTTAMVSVVISVLGIHMRHFTSSRKACSQDANCVECRRRFLCLSNTSPLRGARQGQNEKETRVAA
jgi:hypothetical protein